MHSPTALALLGTLVACANTLGQCDIQLQHEEKVFFGVHLSTATELIPRSSNPVNGGRHPSSCSTEYEKLVPNFGGVFAYDDWCISISLGNDSEHRYAWAESQAAFEATRGDDFIATTLFLDVGCNSREAYASAEANVAVVHAFELPIDAFYTFVHDAAWQDMSPTAVFLVDDSTGLWFDLTGQAFGSPANARALSAGKYELHILANPKVSQFGPVQMTGEDHIELRFICAEDRRPTDLDKDGIVNGSDLAKFLGSFGTSEPTCDFNDDGTVDGNDLAVMLGDWGS